MANIPDYEPLALEIERLNTSAARRLASKIRELKSLPSEGDNIVQKAGAELGLYYPAVDSLQFRIPGLPVNTVELLRLGGFGLGLGPNAI